MNLIICRRCDLAVPAEYIRVHMNGKHGIHCSNELINSIISNYQPSSVDVVTTFRNNTMELDSSVNGVPIKRGFRCLICLYCTPLPESMARHFRTQHKGQNIKEQMEENVPMQILFGGRLRKWFSVKEPGTMPINEGNDDAWIAVQALLAKQEKTMKKRIKEKEENVRLVRGFIVGTGWDIMVEGEDKKKLVAMAAIAKKSDPLGGIMELCQNYFEGISEKLRAGNVLLRRKIASEGFDHNRRWL